MKERSQFRRETNGLLGSFGMDGVAGGGETGDAQGLLRHLGVYRPKRPGNLRELAVEIRMNSASIFDLSPSEKLQLVEDLWDDLAAAPEAVPVHDWHAQELARRKANLLKNPASGLPWEGVKGKVRARYAR
jgi:putative addiction module component (TIGR02574 family)